MSRYKVAYESYYRVGLGQPIEGFQVCTSKRAAINRARALRAQLPEGQGGTTARIHVPGLNVLRPLYCWHQDGGYDCVARWGR